MALAYTRYMSMYNILPSGLPWEVEASGPWKGLGDLHQVRVGEDLICVAEEVGHEEKCQLPKL